MDARSGPPTRFLDPDRGRLMTSLTHVFSVPRSFMREEVYRASAGDYISSKFGMLGLLTGMQMFAPSQFHEMVNIYFFRVFLCPHFENRETVSCVEIRARIKTKVTFCYFLLHLVST